MKIPKPLTSALRKGHVFLLATHVNPDGDALGSSLALAEGLLSLGKKVFVYDRDPVPEPYRFMPGWRKFRNTVAGAVKHNPVLIILDCNSLERTGLGSWSSGISVVIDHHVTESRFGDIRWIERGAAATGIMVFHLLKALKTPISVDMATNLYTAIAVDTGTFRYGNTSEGVLRACADLVALGARPAEIAEHLYERWSRKRFDLLSLALGNLAIQDSVAVMYVTRDMFDRTGTKEEDTENFANLPRMIDSVSISAVVREIDPDVWKVSLRSKGSANVALLAEAFGGGGHKNAAGFRIRGDGETVKRAILRSARKILTAK